MANDLVAQQDVLLLRALADVVDDERSSLRGLPIRNNANVSYPSAEVPRDHIAGSEV